VSGATTSILTDGNTAATNSFAVEQVLPSSDYVFSSPISVQISYDTLTLAKDKNFVAITGAVLTATVEVNSGTQLTVERATADAISQAAAAGQFGDVSGIVRAWSAGTSVLD
jgi:hypothetical protein